MPLRKQGTIVKASVVLAAAVGLAAVPATANAGILSGLFTPKATATPVPTATPKPTATPVPTATPKPTATPAPSLSSLSSTTSAATTTSAAVPAGAGCTPLPTTKAFAGVDGDTSDYSLAPGGSFESGTPSWTLSNGAKVVTGNESLGIQSGSRSLMLPLGGSATSPAFCVDQSNPDFRFAYKIDNASLSGFIAYVIYRDATGAITNVQLVSSKTVALAPSTWQASPKSPLATLIPLNSTAKTASVQLKITSISPVDIIADSATAAAGSNSTAASAVNGIASAATNLVATISGSVSPVLNIGVTIDSVEVDPYRRG